jgi:capsular exopolysaccharide synthesis family protein
MNVIERNQLARTLIGLLRQRVDGLVRYGQRLAKAEQEVRKEVEGISGQLIRIQAIEGEIEWGKQMRDRLLNQLASLSGAEDGPIIRAEKISDPVRATTPTSPNLRRVALLALLAGMATGLAAVYVLDTLDDRFRSVEELQAQVGVPVLAVVQDLPRREGHGVGALQLVAEPDTPESEAFRTLRTSLGLTHDQSRRIVVTSAEPGDGKTTVLANMAVAYASSGKRTLLIDADLRRPGLSNMLGVRGVEGLSNVIRLQGQGPIGEVVEPHIRKTGVPGLDILASGPRPMNPAELLGGQNFADLLAWADSRYDRVLIDSPPALAASDTAIIGQLVDGVLLVIQPLKNQRRMVLRAVESFGMLKIPVIGLVANRVGVRAGSSYYGYAIDYSADREEDFEYFDCNDEVDCPPEPALRSSSGRPGRDGGIDLSQLRDPRHRGAA